MTHVYKKLKPPLDWYVNLFKPPKIFLVRQETNLQQLGWSFSHSRQRNGGNLEKKWSFYPKDTWQWIYIVHEYDIDTCLNTTRFFFSNTCISRKCPQNSWWLMAPQEDHRAKFLLVYWRSHRYAVPQRQVKMASRGFIWLMVEISSKFVSEQHTYTTL